MGERVEGVVASDGFGQPSIAIDRGSPEEV